MFLKKGKTKAGLKIGDAGGGCGEYNRAPKQRRRQGRDFGGNVKEGRLKRGHPAGIRRVNKEKGKEKNCNWEKIVRQWK